MTDAALAYLHLLAILSWTVFTASTAALARPEWLNAAVLQRLQRVDRIATVAGLLVVASGLARLAWGPKPAAWLLAQPLLWAKLALVGLMVAAGVASSRQIAGWLATWQATQQLPGADAVHALRRRVMRSAHLVLLLPLLGVLLVRGIGVVAAG